MILKQKHSAFLLSEVLVSLFITMLTFSCIVYFLTTYREQKISLFRASSDWIVAMLELETISQHASIQQATATKVVIETDEQAKFPHKTYQLQIYHDMLRITGVNQGHMPLLIKQKNLHLKVKNQILQIKAIDQYRRKWEYYVDFQ